MDIVWQTKTADFLLRLLYRDYRGMPRRPLTAHALQGAGEQTALPRARPEEMGVPSAALEQFLEILNATAGQNVHAAMVLRRGSVVMEAFWQPYGPNYPHMLYSVSKSVTATAIGMAVDEGFLALDEKLVDIFAGHPRVALHAHKLRGITLWHLLTMSTGITFNEMGSAMEEDWARAFMGADAKFAPGEAFEYNSLNTYMLSAALHQRTGLGVMEFLKPRLFEPLGIARGEWERCPKGVEKGGWGLSLRLEDAAKIGQLYLQGGEWIVNGETRRILSPQWVAQATSQQIPTPNGEMKYGYGYQIWMCPQPGSYVFNGAFGQYIMVLPSYDMVVAVFSGSATLLAQGAMLQAVQALTAQCASAPLPQDDTHARRLAQTIKGLRYAWHEDGRERDLRAAAKLLAGRGFSFMENGAGLEPVVLQAAHTNFARGMKSVRFQNTPDGIVITWEEENAENTLLVPFDGGVAYGGATFAGTRFTVATRGTAVIKNAESVELKLYVYFVTTPDVRTITINVSGGLILAVFDEIPSLGDAAKMLLSLTGGKNKAYLKHLLKHTPMADLRNRLRQMATPEVVGVEIIT